MQLNTQGDSLLIVSERGMGKRTLMDEFTVQHRGGKGVKCYKINEKTGNVIGVKAVDETREIMIITTEGIIIRLKVQDISQLGRITSGVKLINLANGIKVATISKIRSNPNDENDNEVEGFEADEDDIDISDEAQVTDEVEIIEEVKITDVIDEIEKKEDSEEI